MKITDIKVTKKGRNAIFIDGEYRVSVDSETLFKSKLKVGSLVDEDAFNNVIKKSCEYKAKEKAMRLISYRSHSKKELKDKIKRSIDEDSAELAVKKLEELGLVDDTNFCMMYAKDMFFRKNYSINKVRYELCRKGIEKQIIDQTIESLDVDDKEQLSKLICGKYAGRFQDEKSRRRTVSSLQRLGFKWDDIRSVMRDESVYVIEDDF